MVGRDVDETVLMEKAPATSGKPARWLIRQGQYITVGELFVSGARRCSCWAFRGKGVERPGFNSLGWWHICPALCCQRSIFLRLLTKLSAVREAPATGGKSPRGLIRQAVGEFFVFGSRRCSCWALYRICKSSCRARMAPSSCGTPRGNGASTQASLVWTGEPRAMHVCSARTQPLAGIAVPPYGIQRQRSVQETIPWRGIVVPPPCCARRGSPGPFVAARVLLQTRKRNIWMHWLLFHYCF